MKHLTKLNWQWLKIFLVLLGCLILATLTVVGIFRLIDINSSSACVNDCLNTYISLATLQLLTIVLPVFFLFLAIKFLARRYQLLIASKAIFTAIFLFILLPIVITPFFHHLVIVVGSLLVGLGALATYLQTKQAPIQQETAEAKLAVTDDQAKT